MMFEVFNRLAHDTLIAPYEYATLFNTINKS